MPRGKMVRPTKKEVEQAFSILFSILRNASVAHFSNQPKEEEVEFVKRIAKSLGFKMIGDDENRS